MATAVGCRRPRRRSCAYGSHRSSDSAFTSWASGAAIGSSCWNSGVIVVDADPPGARDAVDLLERARRGSSGSSRCRTGARGGSRVGCRRPTRSSRARRRRRARRRSPGPERSRAGQVETTRTRRRTGRWAPGPRIRRRRGRAHASASSTLLATLARRSACEVDPAASYEGHRPEAHHVDRPFVERHVGEVAQARGSRPR